MGDINYGNPERIREQVWVLMNDIKPFQEEESKEADRKFFAMKQQILELFRDCCSAFEPLYIFETWTRLGMAPNLLYDDDGLFAIDFGGYQSIPDKTKEDYIVSISFSVEKKHWQESPLKAIEYACKNMFED